MTALDNKEFARVVSDCATHSKEALDTIIKLNQSLKTKSQEREGIGLLEVKNRELLAYMLEMANFMDRMGAGQSITESGGFLRAALHRTVLERVKPIEQKLSSQIDKLIKLNEGREVTGNLVPRIDDMEFDDDDKQDDEDKDEDDKKVRRYVAPKMTAMHYDDDDEESKQMKRSKKRALQSSLIQELKQQYSSAPEEYREMTEKKAQKLKEIERFEEDNYRRINVSSKIEKKRLHREKNGNALDKLLDFGAYMVRDEQPRKPRVFKKKEGGIRKITSRSARTKDKREKERGKQRKIASRR